jgi:hypothetical protein
VQEATEYSNDHGPWTGDVQSFCESVWATGIVGMFQQSVEYRKAYAAGCQDAWSDWQ